MWEGTGIGVIVLSSTHARPVQRQASARCCKTFADQAVIAIQNARMFNETQEALEHQTATADILRVISQSPDDIQPVFHAIVGTAFRLLQDDGDLPADARGRRLPCHVDRPAGAAADRPRRELTRSMRRPTSRRGCCSSGTVLHLPDWSARSSCRRTSSACRPATASARR